jgi:formate hydrogenlyase subunit 4
MTVLILLVLYLALAPLVGGLLAGLDRIISARMQSRIGPPVLQPFYDVLKLCQKESLFVTPAQTTFIRFYLLLVIFTGALFFVGGDLLLVIFALTLAGIMFALAGFRTSSPYSFFGASRELVQMMADEPVIILCAVGMYMVTHTFAVAGIMTSGKMLAYWLPGLLVALIFVLPIKLRKSPFDLSMSHHAHQELARGITTEFSGQAMAMIEVAHWYENVVILAFIYLFFAHSPIVGIVAVLLIYFFVIIVDNTFARLKWQHTLSSAWIVTLVLGLGNVLVLSLLAR